MTNSLSEDIYAVGQLMADNLNTVGVSDADVDDGLTTLAQKILNATPSTKVNTVLTLNTPVVVYTDLFTVTGVLKDASDNTISEATIQLIWNDGTEHIATGTTDNSGVFSFTSTDPTSVSSYSFQLFYAGDNDYNASNSSVVNVNTAKETSVLNITSPATGSTVTTDSVTITGTLKDNDGTAMGGKSVNVSLNGGTASSVTVESDGTFSKTVTGLSAGSNSITASFSAITTHTASSQSITVNRSTFDDIELLNTGDCILSYADEQQTPGSQTVTLQAQLMNGQSTASVSGVDVDFYDYADPSNPVKLNSSSIQTNSSGIASYTYTSQGVGDRKVKAYVSSMIVSETYEIHDYYYYDTETVDKNKYEVQSGRSATLSYSNNGLTVTGGSSSDTWVTNTSFSLPTNYEAEVTITAWSGSYYGRLSFENLQVEPNSSNIIIIINGSIVKTWSHTLQANDVIKVVKNGTSMNVYCNNSLIGTYTVTANGIYRRWTYNGRSLTTKNLTVKQL